MENAMKRKEGNGAQIRVRDRTILDAQESATPHGDDFSVFQSFASPATHGMQVPYDSRLIVVR